MRRPFGCLLQKRPHPERSSFPFSDLRLTPHYPANSPLDDVLLKVVPGADEYVTEKYAFEIMQLLGEWSRVLRLHRPRSRADEISGRFDRSYFAGSDRVEIARVPGMGSRFSRRRFARECRIRPRAISRRDRDLSVPDVARGDG